VVAGAFRCGYLVEHDRCGASKISPHDEWGSGSFFEELAR
jgi:hypothetical protein